MITRYCWCGWAQCRCGTNSTGFVNITVNATASNTISIGTDRYGNRRSAKTALELERELEKFERLAKWKPVRPVVKIDEKKLIAKPTRSHAKPHASQSSRAALSVRQFASRVK